MNKTDAPQRYGKQNTIKNMKYEKNNKEKEKPQEKNK